MSDQRVPPTLVHNILSTPESGTQPPVPRDLKLEETGRRPAIILVCQPSLPPKIPRSARNNFYRIPDLNHDDIRLATRVLSQAPPAFTPGTPLLAPEDVANWCTERFQVNLIGPASWAGSNNN
ncbi:hypothetical protein E2P81_ATG07397 [Venturia nashicola]|nr:hypothetical protein E2P81_ATG07397 [Venturia nashicola]